MALPKRKHSKTRRDKKRASKKLPLREISLCPHCHQPKPPHRVCPYCGKYKDRQYIVFKEKKPKQ